MPSPTQSPTLQWFPLQPLAQPLRTDVLADASDHGIADVCTDVTANASDHDVADTRTDV